MFSIRRINMQKYSSEEQATHLAAWRSSGLSGQAYCSRHGIVPTTFYSWVKAEKKRASGEAASSPLLVKVQPTKHPGGSLSAAICIERRDVRIHLPEDIGIESLKAVLMILGAIDAA
jgi:transposase-like protein